MSPDLEVPDFVPATRIWRVFAVGYLPNSNSMGSTLGSTLLIGRRGHVWRTDTDVAVCKKVQGPNHSPPVLDCSCGIYGFFRAEEAWQQAAGSTEPWLVLAHCLFWGTAIMGPKGIRVQNAQIEAAFLVDIRRLQRTDDPGQSLPYTAASASTRLANLAVTYPNILWRSVSTHEELTTLLS